MLNPEEIIKRVNRILQAALNDAKTANSKSRVEEIQLYFNGYASGGDEDPACGIIASANWNNADTYDSVSQRRVETDQVMSRVCALLEKLGVAIEWNDCVTECHNCGKVCETEPSSMWWEPNYVLTEDCELFCKDCADE